MSLIIAQVNKVVALLVSICSIRTNINRNQPFCDFAKDEGKGQNRSGYLIGTFGASEPSTTER